MKYMPEVGVHERRFSFVLLARGALAMVFALAAFATHVITIERLAVLFAIYALLDSGLSFFEAYQLGRADNRRVGWLFAIEGLLSAALAVIAFAAPGVLLLRIIGGLRALVIGASDANWSHRTHASLAVEVAGFASIVLGVLLLVWPGPATLALPWLIGLPSLVSGALMIAGSFGELSEEGVHATA